MYSLITMSQDQGYLMPWAVRLTMFTRKCCEIDKRTGRPADINHESSHGGQGALRIVRKEYLLQALTTSTNIALCQTSQCITARLRAILKQRKIYFTRPSSCPPPSQAAWHHSCLARALCPPASQRPGYGRLWSGWTGTLRLGVGGG